MSAAEFAALGLPDWQIIDSAAVAAFRCESFAMAGRFVAEIAALCDEHDHHAAVDLRFPADVYVTTKTHSTDGLTDADTALARAISAAAGDSGIAGAPVRHQGVDVAIDAMDIAAVRPFWRAVLGYGSAQVTDHSAALSDPAGRGVTVWFQQMDVPRTQRNRVHLDVMVAPEQAEQRVADTIAAGGVLLTDAYSPSFWVLGDPEGNEACVCTWQAAQP